jgi:tRNA threonylcarbamoyladenosine biosynthesis protein TsaB
MALILNIETASPVCSVCLSKDGVLIDCREDLTGNSHAKILTVFINDLFAENGISMAALDAVAVSAGPGSYTGLRIGTSVAKGLCYALNKPLIAVPTLLSMAKGMQQNYNVSSAYYMPVLDARRMDVYTSIYDSGLNEVLKTACITINSEFERSLNELENIYIGGNGADKCRQVFSPEKFHYVEKNNCDSRHMIPFSHKKYMENDFENTALFEPFYLKEFPAKIQIV